MDDLRTVKQEVRSLLISSSTNLTLEQLARDYEKNMGCPLPFKNYKCSNALEFMYLMPDVVQVSTSNNKEVFLSPVEVGKSSHVNKLVMSQRKDKRIYGPKRTYVRSKRPLSESPPQMKKFIYPENISPFTSFEINTEIQRNESYRNNEDSSQQQNFIHPESIASCTNYEATFQIQRRESYQNEQDIGNYLVAHEEEAFQRSLEVIKEETFENNNTPPPPPSPSSPVIFEENCLELSNFEFEEAGSSKGNNNMNETVKSRFRELLQEFTKGILLSKFPSKYKQKYGHSFSCIDYGFDTLKALVLSLPEIFRYEKWRSNDWLLFEADSKGNLSDKSQKWIPKIVLENMDKLAAQYPNGLYGYSVLEQYEKKFQTRINIKKLGFESLTSFLVFCQSVDCRQIGDEIVIFPKNKQNEENDAGNAPPPLPPIDKMEGVWKKYFKEDVCCPTDVYKKFVLPPGPFEYLKIRVVEVENPHKFWIQLLERQTDIINLMEEINIFYEEEEKDYVMDPYAVRKGQMCIARYYEDSRWHRALIIETNMIASSVKLCYVDYGTTNDIAMGGLRYLHKRFADLPVQVIRGELYNVTWPPPHTDWPSLTNNWLFNSAFNKTLVAEVISIDFKEPMLNVMLHDTNGAEDVCLNESIISMDLAQHVGCETIIENRVEEYCDEQLLEDKEENAEMVFALDPSIAELEESANAIRFSPVDSQYSTNETEDDASRDVASALPQALKNNPDAPRSGHTTEQYANQSQVPIGPYGNYNVYDQCRNNNGYFVPSQFNNFHPHNFNYPMYQHYFSGQMNLIPQGVERRFMNPGYYLPTPPGLQPVRPSFGWRPVGDVRGRTGSSAWRVRHPGHLPNTSQEKSTAVVSVKNSQCENQKNTPQREEATAKKPYIQPVLNKVDIATSTNDLNEIGEQLINMTKGMMGGSFLISTNHLKELNELLKRLEVDEKRGPINGSAHEENASSEEVGPGKSDLLNGEEVPLENRTAYTTKKLSRRQVKSQDAIKIGNISNNWAELLKYPGENESPQKADFGHQTESCEHPLTSLKHEESQHVGSAREGVKLFSNENIGNKLDYKSLRIPYRIIYKIGILGKTIHLLRIGNNIMIPTEQFYKQFSRTTMNIVDYRFHKSNMGRPFVKIYEREFPGLFKELKKEQIYGVNNESSELSVIPLKKLPHVLDHLVPKDEALNSAFEKVHDFETCLLKIKGGEEVRESV